MGVDNLLKANFVAAYKQIIPLSRFKGKRFAVDASAFQVLFLYALLEHERSKFLIRAKNLIQLFRKHQIRVLWVFEGCKPTWKYDENQARLKERKRKREEKENAKDILDTHIEQKTKLEFELQSFAKEGIQYNEEVQVKVNFEIVCLSSQDGENEYEPGLVSNNEFLVKVTLQLESVFAPSWPYD